jgi:serine O-acetyltransferase
MNMKNNFLRVLICQYDAIVADAGVYWPKRGGHSILSSLLYIATCHGWHIMFWFRIGKIIYAFPIPIVSHALKVIFQLYWFFLTTFYGIWLDSSNNIGRGFYIGHFGGIVIRGSFGDYCSIGQGVTVGSKGAGKSNGWPRIGSGVYLGAGAKVIGNVVIGNNVVVGANAVVTISVPEGSLAVGIPAQIKERAQLDH